MNQLLVAAYKYINSGICVIATNKNKIAFKPWKKYTTEIIKIEEAEKLFEDPQAEALAVICGATSGNVEVIDIDSKYDTTGALWGEYAQAIKDNDQELFDRLYIVGTISGGYHIYYRCSSIEGNSKLARRPATEEEARKDPNDRVKVLIETRGQNGYVIAPPSRGYTLLQGTEIPTITPAERDLLLELARSFNQYIDRPVTNHTSQGYNPKEYGLSPFEDYNKRGDVVGLLQQHGWTVIRETNDKVVFRRPGKNIGTSGDYLKSKQWFSVFTTSSQFEPNRAYLPYAVYAVLQCGKDFKEAARRLLSEGYGERREYYGEKIERELYKKKKEGLDAPQLVAYVKANMHKGEEEAVEMVDKLTKIWGEKVCTFWDVSDTGKISINRTRLINFLHHTGGFSLYYYDRTSTIFRIVKCRDGFVEEVSSEHIKKFLKEYIESLPDSFDGGITSEDLMELVLKGADTFFSKSILEFLNRSDFDFLKDTAEEAFFPFRNGVVRVNKEGPKLVAYKDIKKVIWRSQVIDYDILIDVDSVANAEYADFVNCVSGDNDERFRYACTLIGYLLHKYKDFAKPYAVILAEENDNENEGGGTGKGIFITALAKFLNTERVDGKNFKLDKNFAFQRVGLDTKLVAIEDCRKNVDFEGFYSIITEGITVEKKNKDELFIPYKDSPKIMFTTNYTISTVGNHAKRRQRVFEFSNFFNTTNTPGVHFGHNLFDEWDKDEWNRFYNFGFVCVTNYLEMGIQMIEATEKIKRKHLRLKYGEQFLEWWDDYVKSDRKIWKMSSDLYGGFMNQYELDKKDYPQTRFGRALNEAAESVSLKLSPEGATVSLKVQKRKNKQAGNKIQVRIAFDHEKEETVDDEEPQSETVEVRQLNF
jgi:hypothetical protein